MPDVPAISVLMSVRNTAPYLAAAIRSVLEQTFDDFEFLIVNDGSTDGSGEIIADHARRDPRIRVLEGPGRGISVALNIGLEHARAALVARMDGDDLCLPTRLEKQCAFMQSHPEHVLVGCRCILIDPQGRPICEKPDTPADHEQIDALLLQTRWPIVHPSVMMRADAVARVGRYLERYLTVEDHDLFLKLAEIGKLANLPEVLMLYRQHFKSTVYTTADSQIRNLVEIVTAACARRGIPVPEGVRVRPPDMVSEAEHRRLWAWRALAAGNKATARHHAIGALRALPFQLESWRAVACALRGH